MDFLHAFVGSVIIAIIVILWWRARHWKHIYFDQWMNTGFRISGNLHKHKGVPHPLDNRPQARAKRIHKLLI